MLYFGGLSGSAALATSYYTESSLLTEDSVTFMLLAVDIGNTQTALGLYESVHADHPAHMWRLATYKHDAKDDITVKLLPLLGAAGVQAADVRSAALASVVPGLTRSWSRAVHDLCGAQVRVCTAEVASGAGLFAASYPNPHEIGADRVADAVAARALYGAPVVVVDFGTATNIEVIDAEGRFIGGIIAPGVETGASALFSHATRLAAVDMRAPESVIGTSSDEAMRSGIILGEAARVDGLVERIAAHLGRPAPVVATGGLAPLIAPHSQAITDVLPELTLEGLRRLAQAAREA